MKKYILLFCLYSLLSTAFDQIQTPSNLYDALFIAIVQGDTLLVERILNHGFLPNIQREIEGNSPLMEAIITLGEKLIEMEMQSLSQDFSDPKNIPDDFRSFLRTFIVSLIIGASSGEIQANIERINNENNHIVITLLQSIAGSFLPVISRSAYAWCLYSLLDYGIATGQKNSTNQSNPESDTIEKYKKTIDLLLSKPTIDVNVVNNKGESALSLVHKYKNKIKTVHLKLIFYQIEQALLKEGAQNSISNYSNARGYQ